MLNSCLIHRGWLLLDNCSTTSRFVEILLHALFFTCFASFCYLVIHSILFNYIHAFIWILCTPLFIFMFLGGNFLTSCTLCQLWQKGGEIVENMWFPFKILRVRRRNTCLYKGEMYFILLGGVLTSFFLYTSLVTTLTYIVLIFDIYIYIYVDDVCLLHLSLHVLFLFFLYTHDSYILYAIFYFCFTLRWRNEFCLKCFRNTGCQSLLAIKSLLAKFFKSSF